MASLPQLGHDNLLPVKIKAAPPGRGAAALTSDRPALSLSGNKLLCVQAAQAWRESADAIKGSAARHIRAGANQRTPPPDRLAHEAGLRLRLDGRVDDHRCRGDHHALLQSGAR